jgi:FkbM family methyltransferase
MLEKPDPDAHDRRILELLRPRLPAEPVIYDVGASNGVWSWRASTIFPSAKFHLFEPIWPVSDVYREMLDWVVKNTPSVKTTHALAIGAKNGETTLHITQGEVGSTTLDIDMPPEFAKRVSVPMLTIDEVVSSGRAPMPHLIKMDIQGGELEALLGATKTLPHVQALLLETWLTRGYGASTPLLREIQWHLAPFGFRLFDLGEQFRFEDGTLYAIEACFIRD